MGEIVNLRRARKARDRSKDAEQAQENRIRFGVSKAERLLAEKTDTLTQRRFEGHRRDAEPPRPSDPLDASDGET